MKSTFIKILFGLLVLTSCNESQIAQHKVENTFSVNPKLTKSISDTLFIRTNRGVGGILSYYEDENGYCKLSNDTTMIFNHEGFFTSKFMTIVITKGTLSFDIHEYSCAYTHAYKTIEQRLTLNKDNFKVNDTIVGEMFFKSIFVLDSIRQMIDTIVVAGKFKFKVRDEGYDYVTLLQEKNYQKFLELARNRPDTLTSLVISNCGLNKLPEEILLFKNLKTLSIEYNDLGNSDLSMLASLTKMETINFQTCNLNKFPKVVFNFKKLRKLNLFDNNIKELPSELCQMTALRELQLGANSYTLLPSEIGNLRNLEMLSVESTPLKVFPKSILQLTKLKVIYPPDTMDYFPPQLAKCLSQTFSYSGLKNLDDFKDKIPKDE